MNPNKTQKNHDPILFFGILDQTKNNKKYLWIGDIRVTPCFSFGISYKSSFDKTIIPCSSLALLAGSANSRQSVTVEDEREVEDDIVGDNEVEK